MSALGESTASGGSPGLRPAPDPRVVVLAGGLLLGGALLLGEIVSWRQGGLYLLGGLLGRLQLERMNHQVALLERFAGFDRRRYQDRLRLLFSIIETNRRLAVDRKFSDPPPIGRLVVVPQGEEAHPVPDTILRPEGRDNFARCRVDRRDLQRTALDGITQHRCPRR